MRLYFLLLSLLLAPAAAAEGITLLANGDTDAWEYQSFDDIKETTYSRQQDEKLQHQILTADSVHGASGYILKRELDLRKTPWLHFLWRVDHVGNNPAEKTREGDDFVWRLYFVQQSGMRFRTLNFVYSQTANDGQTWESPYSDISNDIRIYALATGGKNGVWRTSTVNVAKVWEELFDNDEAVDGVGLMTDGDSAAINMRANYGLLVLSDKPTPPFSID